MVVAPDKFKGSLSALDAADAIARGVRSVLSDAPVAIVPMADGGEGTVDSFLATGARAQHAVVRGPLGEPVTATFALDGTLAICEMAAASGLALVPPERRHVRAASSAGTGDLLRAALDAGATRILIGIGGSATNDGGAGMLEALGATLDPFDLRGLDPRLARVTIDVACDVDNPLLGPSGASAVYGPQKGASPEDVAFLDARLSQFAEVVERAIGRCIRDVPGAGAAGGLGFALLALGARLRPGVEIVAEVRGLAALLAGASWCLTGEGRIDVQTLHGKTVEGVARLARAAGVDVTAFGGAVDAVAEAELVRRYALVAIPIADGAIALDDALARGAELLERAAARAARLRSATARPPA